MIRLALRLRREDAELVLAELLALAPAGVEEVDLGDGMLEYAVYGAPGELPELPDLHAAAGGALVEITTQELPDDWSERWKSFHRPVLIESPAAGVPALYIRPPWESPCAGLNVSDIAIDPAQAFGTGAHATTRLCLQLLLELAANSRGPLLDVGTGSGVLAIAAARLGFAPVLGLDNDPESVRAAEINAQVNDVPVEVRRFDLRAQPLPAAGEGVLVANLLRPLLLELAGTLTAAPTDLLASGLLVDELDEIAQAFAPLGLREHDRRHDGEWAALWLRRSQAAEPTSAAAPTSVAARAIAR
ncbi:MAG TPA: 50S ribosomal protein L11 methyltransferase [Solirubrobacteraceae bacterium]|nr:50S ribosomal protein L11 methyltransferase [Solirubrobacteraceae bacterium]